MYFYFPFFPFPALELEDSSEGLNLPPFLGSNSFFLFPFYLDFELYLFLSRTTSACNLELLIVPILMILFCSCVKDSMNTSNVRIVQVAPGNPHYMKRGDKDNILWT